VISGCLILWQSIKRGFVCHPFDSFRFVLCAAPGVLDNVCMESRENTKINYALKRELRGALYRELLEYALNYCSDGVVVVRSHLSLGTSAKDFLERLHPFLRQGDEGSPWIGAQLFDSQAQFKKFVFCRDSLQILLESSKKLYEWEQPILPEDLSLFRPDGADWLVTMAHSRQAYLSLKREERSALIAAIPKMASIIQ
jgi:hypothetical protein